MSTERYEVVKAGGWSLANAERTKSVIRYIQANPDRRYFVPSAPGARWDKDPKVTDLLLECYPLRKEGRPFDELFKSIRSRYESIGKELGYYDLEPLLTSVEQTINSASFESPLEAERSRDLIASRGEWIEGQMMAGLLDCNFIDPTELIRFRRDGRLDERSYQTIGSRLGEGNRFVIPGFYGLDSYGKVKTFQRDGSDVTGSVIAHGVNAIVYRNLTSTDGVYSADPQTVTDAQRIEALTFKEYRELGNGGTKVLHRDAILPVAAIGIPLNVLYSEKPYDGGTMIVSDRPYQDGEGVIGIAGKGGFASIKIYKMGMEEETGIGRKILQIIERNGISISYPQANHDDISIIFHEQQLTEEREDKIKEEIKRLIKSSETEIKKGMGVLTLVGQGLRENGTEASAKLSVALNSVSIRYGIIYMLGSISVRVFIEDSSRLNEAIKIAHKVLIEDLNS